MPSASSIPTPSIPTPNMLNQLIQNDTLRYKKKGYGLIFAVLITINFFYFGPKFYRLIWPLLLNTMPIEPLYLILVTVFHTGWNVISHLMMYVIYKIKLPFFERYRVSNKPWPWESDPQQWNQLFKKTMKILFIAHFVITPGLTLLGMSSGIKMRLDMESFPSTQEIIVQILFFMVCEDFFFYWSHRLLHHPKLYPYIHKLHHEYNNTVSIASEYAHPIEFIFGNVLPSNSGIQILGSQVHFITYCLWTILRIFETTDGHSGYEFSWSPFRLLPFSGSSAYHNFHHSHNVGNYGSFFTLWDSFCGTNKHFYQYLAKKEKKSVEEAEGKKQG